MSNGDWIMLGIGFVVAVIIGIVAWYQAQEKVLVKGKNRLKSRD